MEEKPIRSEASDISMEEVINRIHLTRNNLIAELSEERRLMNFLEQHFDIVALNQVKIEFLKRDLKALQESPIDLAYYSSMIKLMRASKTNLLPENKVLFNWN